MKLVNNGNYQWNGTWGNRDEIDIGSDYGRAISLDEVGNVYVSGTFDETIDFGGGARASIGDNDVFVLSLDPDGNYR